MERKILEFIKQNHPTYNEVISHFSAYESSFITQLLNELQNDGLIDKMKNQYVQNIELGYIPATVISIKEKFAFATNQEEDFYIPINDLKNAFLNDVVLLRKTSTPYDSRDTYEVFKVVKRTNKEVVGEVFIYQGKKFLLVDKIASSKVSFVLNDPNNMIENHHIIRAKVDKVYANIALVSPLERLGNKQTVGVDVSRIIIANGAPLTFPDEVKAVIDQIPNEVSEEEIKGRTDFRDHIICTIDGDDAKDFDDAVEVSYENGIYTIGVHIADVSHYVKEGSAIDKEALNRATSLYVQDRVVPMLPFELSNGICSLNPHVTRLTTSCIFQMDKKGKILSSTLCKGVIKSYARLTYKNVNKFLKEEASTKKEFTDLEKMLLLLKEASDIIRKKREKAGGLDLTSTELTFLIDEQGNPYEIGKRKQDVAEKLIEDLMIKANEIVAETIEKKKLPMVYRIHEQPNQKKLVQYQSISKFKGYPCSFDYTKATPRDISSYLETITNEDDKLILSSLLLRCLAKAKYSIENKKHFGLASSSYTHFTSPIRRYPDLIVHRLIERYIVNKDILVNDEFKYHLEKLAFATSRRERRALAIERSVNDLLCAKYMRDHLGDEYEGKIVSMMNQGLFVEIENGIQGFVPFESISGDYYVFDENYYIAYGVRKNKHFALGDKINVVVCNVDLENHQITFNLYSKAKKKNVKTTRVKHGRKGKNNRY